MITIVLPISREEYLSRVLSCLELLDCDATRTNILGIVDGNDDLYIKARNIINTSKFNERLVVKSNNIGMPPKIDIQKRRERITAIHNQARSLISHNDGYVFLVEDDTVFGSQALNILKSVASRKYSTAITMGVEVGRWGAPYIGAWTADDIYDITELTSVDMGDSSSSVVNFESIDAGGLYCTLVRTDLYKETEFWCHNGLGPDINFGLDLRRKGYDNYIVWSVKCDHYNNMMNKESKITVDDNIIKIKISKFRDGWRVSS